MQGAADLVLAIDNGLVTQMSVGMEVDPDGDLWSGSDDWGMPNKRDIVRLKNIFDASAVTYPASPTTAIALARSAWANVPVAPRERTRRLWEDARDVRAGRGTQAQADAVMHVLEALHAADTGEGRAAPTAQDAVIADLIADAKKAVDAVLAAQAKDPDAATDPDDKKVLAALQA